MRRGWRFGAEDFLERLVEAVERPARSGHGRSVHEETEGAIARRIVREELKRAGWREVDLPRRMKGDQVKVRMARRLRGETALTLREIADLLHMDPPTYVAHLLHHRR